MIHLYKVVTTTKHTLLVVAEGIKEAKNILKSCNIETRIIRTITVTDNIIISKELI